jgi:hypothetical protein
VSQKQIVMAVNRFTNSTGIGHLVMVITKESAWKGNTGAADRKRRLLQLARSSVFRAHGLYTQLLRRAAS